MENKDFLDTLTKLHSLLNEINKGDSDYEKYYTLRKINGEDCKYLPILAGKIKLSNEMRQLIERLHGFQGPPGS